MVKTRRQRHTGLLERSRHALRRSLDAALDAGGAGVGGVRQR